MFDDLCVVIVNSSTETRECQRRLRQVTQVAPVVTQAVSRELYQHP